MKIHKSRFSGCSAFAPFIHSAQYIPGETYIRYSISSIIPQGDISKVSHCPGYVTGQRQSPLRNRSPHTNPHFGHPLSFFPVFIYLFANFIYLFIFLFCTMIGHVFGFRICSTSEINWV